MTASGSPSPGDDDAEAVARLGKELEEAEAALARVTEENGALKRALGEPVGAAPARRTAAKRAPGGYRDADARTALEADLAKVNSAAASLAIDNAILQSRLDELGPAPGSSTRWRAVWWVGRVILVGATMVAWRESPRVGGPTMLLLVTVGVALYASYGWFLLFSAIPRHRLASAVLARKPTPIATATAGRTLAIHGVVQGREGAFDAWFPEGERAVWHIVKVLYTSGRRRELLATRKREARSFLLADADGNKVRVEPAGAEIVPEELSSMGRGLSRAGRRELDAIGGILGDRDYLEINMEVVRLGAAVVVEGRLSDDPEPVMRATPGAPLRIVTLDRGGSVAATKELHEGLRIGLVYGAIALGCGLLFGERMGLL
jgi:hypothetical protein